MSESWGSEEAMAVAVSSWLTQQGWDVYHEVCARGGSPRADIVATHGPLLWVVEAKLSFGLGVVAQALGWVGQANFISIAIPRGSSRKGKGKWLLEDVVMERGLGLIEVPGPSTVEAGDVGTSWSEVDGKWVNDPVMQDYSWWKVRGPRLDRHANVKPLRDLLQPEHKAARPGSKAKFFTPFLATCRDVIKHVEAQGGRVLVKDTMAAVAHHYHTDQSARGSMVSAVRRGIVPGLEVVEEGRRLFFVVKR